MSGISLDTGELVLDDRRFVVGAATTLAELRAAFPSARTAASNGAWRTYDVGTHMVRGTSFAIQMAFQADVLNFVHLVPHAEENDHDWDIQRERARKLANDEWLGRPSNSPDVIRYPWGRVDSVLDVRGGERSGITIHYVLP